MIYAILAQDNTITGTDVKGMVGTIGQLGIATILIMGMLFLAWKFAPKAIEAANNVAASFKGLANSVDGLKASFESSVDNMQTAIVQLKGDGEKERAVLMANDQHHTEQLSDIKAAIGEVKVLLINGGHT